MTTHQYHPDHYFRTMGTHEPVLHICPGDHVATTVLDAAGRDATGEQIVPGWNPMTGPFFVEGAEPGDRLALHLIRISPNRPTGWSSWELDPSIVEPGFVTDLPMPEKGQPWQPAIWEIDHAAGVVTLREPETALGRLHLPLDPMLGCFGVAPEGEQRISTATSGPYGGNMDYRGFRAGVTVYLPVFVPGALLFLGDGHAAQSDGEIAGTGVEVSMDVEVGVELIKQKPIFWPRGENAEEIFTVGNARPLLQALQHATTEMIRWLKADYGLDARSAGLLAGQAVTYEVGNVFDPAYTMVCKLKKDVLAQFKQ